MSNTLAVLGLSMLAGLAIPAGGPLATVERITNRKTVMVDLYRFLHRHFPHIVDCQPIDASSCLQRAGFEVVVASESVSIWGLPVLAVVAIPEVS